MAKADPLPSNFIEKHDLPLAGLSLPDYFREALYQHHCSYPETLGVPELLKILPLNSPKT